MGKGSGSGKGAIVADEASVCTLTSLQTTTVKQLPRKPRGLQNVGNTCYANATLQCLLHTALAHALLQPESVKIFRRYSSNPSLLEIGCTGSVAGGYDSEDDDFLMLTKEERRLIRRKEKQRRKMHETSQWLTNELTEITRKYMSAPPERSIFFLEDPTIVDPAKITRHPDRLSNCLRPYQQEDSHEFMRALLSTLTMNGHNKQLSSLFDGLLESAVTCQYCHNVSITRDRYMDLSLDIAQSEVKNLNDALSLFTKTELLDGDNKVFCQRCCEKQMVSKGLRLATAPSVLVCHLKRFAFDKYGRMIRLSKHVDIPLKLNLGNYMSRMNKAAPPPYELVGVLVHQGRTCDSGHYLSYVKSGSKWYKANDQEITQVELEVVLRQPAYILMYEVAGMRARHTKSHSSSKLIKNQSQSHVPDSPRIRASGRSEGERVSSSLLSLLCTASEVNEAIFRDFCCGAPSSSSSRHDEDIVVQPHARLTSQARYRFRDDTTISDETIDNTSQITSDSLVSENSKLRKSSSSGNLRELENRASKAYRRSPHRSNRSVGTPKTNNYSRKARSQSARASHHSASPRPPRMQYGDSRHRRRRSNSSERIQI